MLKSLSLRYLKPTIGSLTSGYSCTGLVGAMSVPSAVTDRPPPIGVGTNGIEAATFAVTARAVAAEPRPVPPF